MCHQAGTWRFAARQPHQGLADTDDYTGTRDRDPATQGQAGTKWKQNVCTSYVNSYVLRNAMYIVLRTLLHASIITGAQ